MQLPGNNSGSNSNSSCRSLLQLPTAVQLHIWSLLPPNERALSCRLVCRDARNALRDPHHSTALLSQPLPPCAAPWAKGAGQLHVRRLPFRHKPQLLCTAAASGSEVNLEVAWAWLQPSLFQELLKVCEPGDLPDPGEAAVRVGHPQLLGWLVRCCPGLLHPDRILQAAAQLYDLAGLKQAWQVLDQGLNGKGDARHHASLDQGVLDAAAASDTPDAVAKMEWLLGLHSARCRMEGTIIEAAARSGDLCRLRWLRDNWKVDVRYCLPGWRVLRTAMQHAGLAVVEWLVAEAGSTLPDAVHRVAGAAPDARSSAAELEWAILFQDAARGHDGVAKLLWLREQGAPQLRDMRVSFQQDIALAAVKAGRVEAVRHLLSFWPPGAVLPVSPEEAEQAAAASGSIAMAECVLGAGLVFGPNAYRGAAEAGSVDMVRWLVHEAGAPVKGVLLWKLVGAWPDRTPADARGLLEAVQLLVGAGHVSESPQLDVAIAARRGNLALVQYLVQQQQQQQGAVLPGERTLVVRVAAGGCVALLEWLAEQAPHFREALGTIDADSYVDAAKAGDKAMLVALEGLGVQWGARDVVVLAVRRGVGAPVLRWLAKRGVPVGTREDMDRAVADARVRGMSSSYEEGEWVRRLAV